MNEYWGLCPNCEEPGDHYINLGREQWAVCEDCKNRWLIGDNIFSSWRYETPETQAANAAKLARYGVVEAIQIDLPEIPAKARAKAGLLDHYSYRDPVNFYQYDFFTDVGGGDDVVVPDRDGDCVFGTFTTELMTGGPAVRILIPEGTDREAVIQGVQKLLGVIRAEGHWPPYSWNDDAPEGSRYAKGLRTWGHFSRIDYYEEVEPRLAAEEV